MEENSICITNPFWINIDPMERLLLLNFEKDPDELYIGFEPQVFDDGIHGRGHIVIGWRMDGRVDVYYQPGLKLDPEGYDIVGKGLSEMVETEFTEAYYEVNDFGAQAHYEFNSIDNRLVIIKISERNPRRRKPFGLLAPMGDAAEKPSAMPLVLLNDFYFIRKNNTEAKISINGRSHKFDELPVPMDGARMFYARYSPQPLIATLNPAFDGELKPINIEHQQRLASTEELDIELDWVKDRPYIKSLTHNNKIHPLTLKFTEAFPDIRFLENGSVLSGEFEIKGHPTTGKIGGIYEVRKDDEIKVKMIPTKGWEPSPSKLSLRFMYSVAKIFKNWPRTYEWTAIIRGNGNGVHHMQSKWDRIR
ncbi:MAG: hypothetical protein NUK57_03435 [Gudongella sp.]|nr:hypothetical protein [Gudongella sp.]